MSVFASPSLQESTWSLTAETVIVGHETEKGECLWETRWPETGIMADVGDP